LKVHYAPVYAAALILPIILDWRRVVGLVNGIRQSLVRPERPVAGTERVWLALLLMIAILHFFVVAKPEVGYDAQAVHMQFAALFADQHRWPHDVARYAWALMPLGADFAYASAFILGGGEQAARLLNLVFGAFALHIVFVLVRRETSRDVALASVCLVASTPLAYLETGSLFVENLWCAFLLGALLLALDFARTRSTTAFLALAFLAAGAMQTKAIAIVWLAPILAAVALWSRRRNVPKPGRRGAVLLAIALVIAAFPYVNAWLRTGNPLFPFFNNIFRSPYFDSQIFSNPVYQSPLRIDSIYTLFISSGKFIEGFDGAAGFHWLLLLPIIALGFTRRRPAAQWLTLSLAVIFFVVVYSQQAYLRYLLPFLLLLAVLGGWTLGEVVRAPAARVALAVVGGMLVVTNVLLMNTGVWWNATLCTGCALGQGARMGYVARYAPDRIVAQYLTDTVPSGRVGFFVVNAAGASGFTGYSRGANWHDVRVYRALTGSGSADDVLAIARRYGLTHVVVLDATQDSVSPIAAFRDAYTLPLWSFNGYLVAAIKPPSP
jgi:Dolichyl-phosphate-mannose-protein mannosyltransferase